MNLPALSRYVAFLGAIALPFASALAAVDNQVVVLSSSIATGVTPANSPVPIGSFGYDPINDVMYVSGFGASAEMRKISGVSTGSPSFETQVTASEQQLYYRDGDPNISVGNPTVSAIMLNPVALGTGPGAIAPYQTAVLAEIAPTRIPGSTSIVDPEATKRFYRYNLQQVPVGGDGRDVYTTLVTMSDMQDAVGTTNTTTNQGRHMGWSGDGQSLYFSDSSVNFGGIWKLNPLTGATQRLTTETFGTSEFAITSGGGVDTIYSRGHEMNNPGGIDRISITGTTVGPRTAVLTGDRLREFFDAGTDQVPTVSALVFDDDGNLYFNNTDSSPDRRGIYMLDAEGRLAKIVSHAERNIFLSESPNANTLRMQTRTVDHPTAGPTTQIMYTESATQSISGAYVFGIGDFDRDGMVTFTDFDMLNPASPATPVVQTRGGAAIVNHDHYRFDLNGNSIVDWRDVKVLQEFTGFATGDVNFDFTLGLDDLDVLGANYFTTASPLNKVWTTGDLGSVDPLYAANAVDANKVDAVDVNLFADAWFDLEQSIAEAELTSRGYAGQFLDDVLAAFGFSASLPGDFDVDGDVDGADFLDWQRQVGSAVPNGTGADANGDGTVDGLDLAEWSENFGEVAASPAGSPAAASVPEPAALSLVAVAVAMVASFGRHRKAH
jgi:hypothetical protein